MKKFYVAMAVIGLVALGSAALAIGPGSSGYGAGPCAGGPCWQAANTGDNGPAVPGAYGPGAGPRRGGRMAAYLNLSQEQVSKMTDLRQKCYQDLKPIRDQLFQKMSEARKLFTDPAADEAAILAKQREVSAAQQTLRDRMTQLRIEERRILTPEQLNKLEEMPRGRGGFGHGRWSRG